MNKCQRESQTASTHRPRPTLGTIGVGLVSVACTPPLFPPPFQLQPLPDPINIPFLMVPVLSVMFFVGDTGEELGWSGYAIDPMQNRWGALKASFVLGVVWAIWHSIPWVQTGNSPTWVVGQGLKTVAMRMVIVWIYNKTGKSVFAATLYHTTDNVSWSLFPNYGSHYDPFVAGMITWLAAVIVAFGWRARTLGRSGHAEVGYKG